MTKNIKNLLIVFSTLCILVAIFALIQLNIADAAKENGKKFDDWVVSCTPKNEETKTPEKCQLIQQLLNDKKQQVALFQFDYFGDKKELRLIQTLPFGVALQAGTSIMISDKLIANGKFYTCLNDGCKSISIFSKEDLKELFSSKTHAVAFMTLNGQQANFPFSIKGLNKGLKYIK